MSKISQTNKKLMNKQKKDPSNQTVYQPKMIHYMMYHRQMFKFNLNHIRIIKITKLFKLFNWLVRLYGSHIKNLFKLI